MRWSRWLYVVYDVEHDGLPIIVTTSLDEVANLLGVKKELVYFYFTPSYIKRVANRPYKNRRYEFYKMRLTDDEIKRFDYSLTGIGEEGLG